MQLSPLQQQAVDDRSPYLLVSAGAGAGKTAVLVERILGLILNDGIALNRILIMTFTRAAASELKERIARTLLQNAKEHPRLYKEYEKLYQANIGTMHSFCSKLIREYWPIAGINPKARLEKEPFLKRLFLKCLKNCLRETYENPSEHLKSLQLAYTQNEIELMLEELYNKVQSFPKPFEWLKKFSGLEESENTTELYAPLLELFHKSITHIQKQLAKLIEDYEQALNGDYEEKVLHIVQGDIDMLSPLVEEQNLATLYELTQGIKFATWPRTKDKTRHEELKNFRDKKLKACIEHLKEDLVPFLTHETDLAQQLHHTKALTELLIILHRLFSEMKHSQKVLDFHDLEQLALKVLDNDDVAELVKAQFDAIFVDECQDNAIIQEEIIRGLKSATNTVFMVGDVKQSIYRFRNAEPSLFIEKLKTFGEHEGQARKIMLNANYRSNPLIIDACNRVFNTLFKEEATELNYIKGQDWLNAGRTDTLGVPVKVRNLLYNGKVDKLALQAAFIAKQIKALVGTPHPSKNKLIEYKDIAILCPKMKGVGEVLCDYLENEKIPFYSDLPTSAPNNAETEILLSWLAFLLDPFNDLALLAVLRNPAINLSSETLAHIRMLCPHQKEGFAEAFYYCASLADPFFETEYKDYGSVIPFISEVRWNELNPEEELYTFREALFFKTHPAPKHFKKPESLSDEDFALCCLCNNLRRLFSQERFLGLRVPIDIYLWNFICRSGIHKHFEQMVDGDVYLDNIRTFCLHTVHYIRDHHGFLEHYLEECGLVKAKGDSLNPVLLSPHNNLVRMMTIHKSKGLEFDIVFLMGLNESLGGSATHDTTFHIDHKLGLTLPYRDGVHRVRHKTAYDEGLKHFIASQGIAERARVLYVALTRPREVLYLVQAVKEEKWAVPQSNDPLALTLAKTYMEWLYMACLNDEDAKKSEQIVPFGEHLLDQGLEPKNLEHLPKEGEFFAWHMQTFRVEDPEALLSLTQVNLTYDDKIALAKELLKLPPTRKVQGRPYPFKDTRINFDLIRWPKRLTVKNVCGILEKSDTFAFPLPISDHAMMLPPPHPVPEFRLPPMDAHPEMDSLAYDKPLTPTEVGTYTHFLIEELSVPLLRKLYHAKGSDASLRAMVQNPPPTPSDPCHTPFLTAEKIASLTKELKCKTLHSSELLAVEKALKDIIHDCQTILPKARANFSQVNLRHVSQFYISPLGIRLLNSHHYHKEKSFTLHFKGWDVDILNGKIDLCFVENGEWIIVDFKNEWLNGNIPKNYLIQMALYKLALDTCSNFKVKECFIYAVPEGKAYRV